MCYYRFGSFRDFPKLTGNSQIRRAQGREKRPVFQNMKCSHCGAEFEGNFCTACGAKAEPCPQPSPEIPTDRPRSQKPKKPIYKKWWFYVIVAVVVIAIAGRISGGSKSEKIDWDDMVLGAQLPQPPAKKGQIHTNTADELWVDIEKISDKQYADYVQACQTVGFTVDAESNSSSFSAYNAEGYKLELSYYGNREGLSIRLEKPMEMGPITWPDSEAGRQLPAPKSLTGKFSFEYDDNFFVYIGGTSRDDYNAYVSACRDKGFTVDYNKGDNYYRANNDAGWQVSIDYEGNQIMSIRIDAPDTSSGSTTSEPSPDSSTSSATAQNDGKLVNGMRKDFKEAMDSYEAFMNEYVAFMKKYNANPNDPTLMADYARYMSKYADACEKFNKWESADMNDAETAYYIDVQARVSKKLLEAAG